jgi:hypothetical protein
VALKTYLQIVNKTLQLLREPLVGAVSGDYPLLIGEYVNQAKEKVEKAWHWRSLLTELTFTTVASQTVYPLNAVGPPVVTSSTGRYPDERSALVRAPDYTAQVFDVTLPGQNYYIREMVREDAIREQYVGASSTFQQIPYAFSYFGGQTPQIELIAQPPVGRIIKVRMTIPQDEFSVGTEVALVPWRPIVSLAYALANDERGEELGQSGDMLFAKAADDLALAIANETEGLYLEMQPD